MNETNDPDQRKELLFPEQRQLLEVLREFFQFKLREIKNQESFQIIPDNLRAEEEETDSTHVKEAELLSVKQTELTNKLALILSAIDSSLQPNVTVADFFREYFDKIYYPLSKSEPPDDDLSQKIKEVLPDINSAQEFMSWFQQNIDLAIRDQKIEEINAKHEDMAARFGIDHLTRVHNRDGLMSWLAENGWEGKGALILIVDADNLKKINDTRGHGAGDDLLIELVKILKTGGIIREGDELARIGGDEFLIIIPIPASNLRNVQMMRELTEKKFAKLQLLLRERVQERSLEAVSFSLGGGVVETELLSELAWLANRQIRKVRLDPDDITELENVIKKYDIKKIIFGAVLRRFRSLLNDSETSSKKIADVQKIYQELLNFVYEVLYKILIRDADSAVYQAKNAGKNQSAFVTNLEN